MTAFLPLSVLLACLRPASAPAQSLPAVFLEAEAGHERTPRLPDALQPPDLRQSGQGHSPAGGAPGVVHDPAAGDALAQRTSRARFDRRQVGADQQWRSALRDEYPGRRASGRKWRATPGERWANLRAQPWDRPTESRDGRPANLLPAGPGRLGAQYESSPAGHWPAWIRRAAVRPPECAMGRPGGAAAITVGLSRRRGTRSAGRTDSGPLVPTAAGPATAAVALSVPAVWGPSSSAGILWSPGRTHVRPAGVPAGGERRPAKRTSSTFRRTGVRGESAQHRTNGWGGHRRRGAAWKAEASPLQLQRSRKPGEDGAGEGV